MSCASLVSWYSSTITSSYRWDNFSASSVRKKPSSVSLISNSNAQCSKSLKSAALRSAFKLLSSSANSLVIAKSFCTIGDKRDKSSFVSCSVAQNNFAIFLSIVSFTCLRQSLIRIFSSSSLYPRSDGNRTKVTFAAAFAASSQVPCFNTSSRWFNSAKSLWYVFSYVSNSLASCFINSSACFVSVIQ